MKTKLTTLAKDTQLAYEYRGNQVRVVTSTQKVLGKFRPTHFDAWLEVLSKFDVPRCVVLTLKNPPKDALKKS